jgi:hypothetical protein
VRRQLERKLGAPRPTDRVRAHATVERLADAQRPDDGAVVEPSGAVLVSEDRYLVPAAPAPPQNPGAADVEGGGDEDAHASAHELVERRQQRLGLAGNERVDHDRVLGVAEHVRGHGRRKAVPGDREPPEPRGDLVQRARRVELLRRPLGGATRSRG